MRVHDKREAWPMETAFARNGEVEIAYELASQNAFPSTLQGAGGG